MSVIPTIPPTHDYPFPLLRLDAAVLVRLVTQAMADHVPYRLGGKAPHLGDGVSRLESGIDCSGWVRYCLYQASGGAVVVQDGSVNMHTQIAALGFKHSENSNGSAKDGRVRIGFLRPQDTDEGIGHVLLLLNGETIESYGGHGPDRRAWGSRPWMSKMTVYVLAATVEDNRKS